jgi:hypothetical protein
MYTGVIAIALSAVFDGCRLGVIAVYGIALRA